MKSNLILSVIAALFSVNAFAYSGGHSLVCKATKTDGNKQDIEFKISRSNDTGTTVPKFELTVDGKAYNLPTVSENKSYGETVHNAPLGLIHVTARNTTNDYTYYFNVDAIPSTVRAYDPNTGKLIKWSLKDQKDADGCYDSAGKAKFRGLFDGYTGGDGGFNVQTILMDCELDYDSGMAC